MSKIKSFFNKPRNVYFSLILMLTVVTGLVSITFSYYVDESPNKTKLVSLSVVDNKIQSDSLKDGKITIPANSTIDLTLYVMSNNNFDSKYNLFYNTSSDKTKVYSIDEIDEEIGAHDVQEVNLTVENYDKRNVEVSIDIASGYIGKDIEISGNKILQK